ncbi:hypothetical protein AHiyo8_22550 [Arthrobacter sp. Hiyo8]|nr:hypothetical protein AHiyo8_22550 [Arthrobacter sp. Hiyo8]
MSKARLMLTSELSATLPRTNCWASVVRFTPEKRQTSAVLVFGAIPCSQRWNALEGRDMNHFLLDGFRSAKSILRCRHIELCLILEPAGPHTPQVRTSGFFHAPVFRTAGYTHGRPFAWPAFPLRSGAVRG